MVSPSRQKLEVLSKAAIFPVGVLALFAFLIEDDPLGCSPPGAKPRFPAVAEWLSTWLPGDIYSAIIPLTPDVCSIAQLVLLFLAFLLFWLCDGIFDKLRWTMQPLLVAIILITLRSMVGGIFCVTG